MQTDSQQFAWFKLFKSSFNFTSISVLDCVHYHRKKYSQNLPLYSIHWPDARKSPLLDIFECLYHKLEYHLDLDLARLVQIPTFVFALLVIGNVSLKQIIITAPLDFISECSFQ